MAFEITTAVEKMLAMTARKKVVQGATSSGKTYGIIPIAIDRCLETPRLKATIVAESIPAVKDGAVDIFKDFMMDEGRWNDDQWIGNPLEYTFLNGSKLQFKSFDSLGKAKAAGKRDFLFMNEANHITFRIADALMIRSKEIWMDFNADNEFWAHTETLTEPNSEFLKLTYLDNEELPEETLEELMIKKTKADLEEARGQKGYWWNWWQVYGLGEIGNLQGVVFDNWDQVDDIPQGAKFVGNGLDFGYTNDPSALVQVYEFEDEYYFDEIIYKKGMSNRMIYNESVAKNVQGIVYADHEPKSIDELRGYGMRIKPAEKGKDSINYGIEKMQEKKFHVTKRSLNLINELRNYKWATDRTGKSLNHPMDAFNHAIDAVRYVFTTLGKYKGRYMVGST